MEATLPLEAEPDSAVAGPSGFASTAAATAPVGLLSGIGFRVGAGRTMEEEKPPWRILEFYSGIGGMRYSLATAAVRGEVVEAFDINDCANDVYEHNFGHRPFQGNIQSLSSDELDKYGANAWLMSPPCQPYTRQGLQKHSADARASSFINILQLLPHMRQPPAILFVENVVGFESSDTHDQLLEILKKSGFTTQECILNPLQFGIPYSRPRYFCLAKRRPLSFQNSSADGQLLTTPIPFLGKDSRSLSTSCRPIRDFLQIDTPPGEEASSDEKFHVPGGLIRRWGAAMDVVFPGSQRCCCFTKSYYRYIKGTGSLLATIELEERAEPSLEDLGLRYFTPREVANLHSFPGDFGFPAAVSLRQRYALLGNSLSVAVVGSLLQYLFSGPLQESGKSTATAPG